MTPPDSQGKPTEEEWDKVGDVLEIIEKCMNVGSSHMGGCNPENHLQEALAQARAEGRAEGEAEFQEMLLAEHRLSDAYLRIRQIVGAFDTPKSPTAEEVWAHTESKVLAERTRREEAEKEAKGLEACLLQAPMRDLGEPYLLFCDRYCIWLISTRQNAINAYRAKRKGEKG